MWFFRARALPIPPRYLRGYEKDRPAFFGGHGKLPWSDPDWPTRFQGSQVRQSAGFDCHGQRIASILFGHDARMLAIVNPGHLILEHAAQQIAIAVQLVGGLAVTDFDLLENIQCLVTSECRAIFARAGVADIELRAGEQFEQAPRLFLIGYGADSCAHGNPFLERDIAAFEEEPEFLAVHPARLCKAVIEVYQPTARVTHGAIDLFLEVSAGTQGALGGDNLATAKPCGEEIKKMDAVLDEDAAALLAIPKPMIGPEPLVRGVILEIAVQELAEDPAFDHPPDNVRERIIALHQIGDQQQALLSCHPNHLVRFSRVHRQRLFANDVFAGAQGFHCLRVVKKRGSSNIDQVDIFARQQFVAIHGGNAEPARHGKRRFTMSGTHCSQFHTGDLHELLQGEQAKSSGPERADPDRSRVFPGLQSRLVHYGFWSGSPLTKTPSLDGFLHMYGLPAGAFAVVSVEPVERGIHLRVLTRRFI